MWWIFGIGLLLLVVLGLAGRAQSNFTSSVQQGIEQIEKTPPTRLPDLDELPPLIRTYLERSGVDVGQTYSATQLRQEGTIKLQQEGDWREFEARQWFAVDRPAFLWAPSMPMPVGSVKGVDRLDGEEGRLEMRLFGIVPVANEGGSQILKAQLLRYIAELPWAPQAFAINDEISFEQLDDRTVRATAEVGEVSATIEIFFDDEGDIVRVETDERPWQQEDGSYTPMPWGGTFADYREFDGIRVPTDVEVYWELPDGRYTYFRADVTNFGSR